jgi:hypothetical protein
VNNYFASLEAGGTTAEGEVAPEAVNAQVEAVTEEGSQEAASEEQASSEAEVESASAETGEHGVAHSSDSETTE